MKDYQVYDMIVLFIKGAEKVSGYRISIITIDKNKLNSKNIY